VQAAETDFAVIEDLLNARHERDANPVAQLHEIETELLDLAQHRFTGGVTARIPTGGKRNQFSA
jgi:hypothetical protein